MVIRIGDSWSAALDDDGYAQALAALFVANAVGLSAELVEESSKDQLVAAIRAASQPPADPIRVDFTWYRTIPAQVLRDAWRKAVDQGRPGPRFELLYRSDANVLGSASDFATGTLLQLLRRPSVRASSVYVARDDPGTPVPWNWPLRIGVLPDHRTDEVEAVVRACPWPQLVELVRLSGIRRECDLLLLGSGLRSAAAALLQYRGSVRSTCVLVMGLLGEPTDRASKLLAIMQDITSAHAIGVAFLGREGRSQWFLNLIRELSHDLPIDRALFLAGKTPPLLIASRRFIQASRISVQAKDLAGRLAAEMRHSQVTPGVPSSPDREFRQLEQLRHLEALSDGASFTGEEHGATEYVRIKELLPADVRVAARAPRPERTPERDRSVLATTFGADDDLGERSTLVAGHTYFVSVRVGYPKGADAVGPTFEEDLLPDRERAHQIRVVFCELPQEGLEETRQPETTEITLPPTGESEPAGFYFYTKEQAKAFDARIVLLLKNRVLHTLRYHADLDGESRITLSPEVAVHALSDLDGCEPFDAAIVVNKTGDRMGVLTISDEAVRYDAPSGLEDEVRTLSALLSEVAALERLPSTISDKRLMTLLFQVANRGHVLWRTVDVDSHLAKASRVHVVSARAGEVLPVEFFYPRPAPQKNALCAHGQSFAAAGVKARCTSVDPRVEVCPGEFWGLNRVIEHVSYSDRQRARAAGPPVVNMFRKAVLGVSENVRKRDATKLSSALRTLTGEPVAIAKNWEDWRQRITEERPSLLVLLPHSEQSHPETGMPALEIGGDQASVSWIDSAYVAATDTPPPVVLLLGCTTTVTDLPFQSFAEAFKGGGSAVVLGTLSIVLGRHAGGFAIALLEKLKEAVDSEAQFGDVLLDAKRRRIAAGDPFALSLIAYGDSSLRL